MFSHCFDTFCPTLPNAGSIKCGGIPMAIGVTSDMATPALIKFGSEELKQQFLVPTISGDFVACLGVSEAGAGSDVASVKTTAVKKGGESSGKKEVVLKRLAVVHS